MFNTANNSFPLVGQFKRIKTKKIPKLNRQYTLQHWPRSDMERQDRGLKKKNDDIKVTPT